VTSEDTDKIAASVIAALDVDNLGRKARSVREIAALVGGGVALVASVTIAAVEVQSKPDSPEVQELIREGTERHREKTARMDERINRVEVAVEDVAEVRKDVQRIEDVQGYLIEQSLWQGDILEHIAGGNRGRVPQKPETLKAKERELLRK
jgi:hypothetical protein